MINKIDHIGIAVTSIEEARDYYEKALGLKASAIEEVGSQKVRTVFFQVGEVHVELLEATSPESPIAKFIEKNGPGVHHIGFGTDNVIAQLEQARSSGIRLINEAPMIGAGGKQIAFLHPKSTFGVLTELCERGEA